jgi:hypothetical protein
MRSQHIEFSSDLSAADGRRDDGRQRVAGELADDVENAAAAAVDGGIGAKGQRLVLRGRVGETRTILGALAMRSRCFLCSLSPSAR